MTGSLLRGMVWFGVVVSVSLQVIVWYITQYDMTVEVEVDSDLFD